jgi:hypothetical protein
LKNSVGNFRTPQDLKWALTKVGAYKAPKEKRIVKAA